MNTQAQKSEIYRNLALLGFLLLLLMVGRFQLSPQLLANLLFGVCFVAISIVSWQNRKIPALLLLPLGALALLLVLANPQAAWSRLAGGLFAFLPFALVAYLRPQASHRGDIALVLCLGLAFGFPNILWALLIGMLSGFMIALVQILARGRKTTELPFAPFLCFGALVTLVIMPLPGL